MSFLVTAWLLVALTSAPEPLSGKVVDADGKPVAGADIWLSAADTMQSETTERGHVKTDGDGRFSIAVPATTEPLHRWMLWAYSPPGTITSRGLGSFPERVEGPHVLILTPRSGVHIRVFDSEGKPASGARVQPSAHMWPAPVREKVAAVTDDQGRAVLASFGPAARPVVDVAVQGQLTQTLSPPADSGEKTIRLLPVGRITARLVGNDPKALAGWTITAAAKPDTAGISVWPACLSTGRTDASGRVTLGPLTEGQVALLAVPPEGVPYLPSQPARRAPLLGRQNLEVKLKAGENLEVELPVKRAVKVVGSVREHGTGKPAAGVKVDVSSLGRGASEELITDSEGRFSLYRLPETIRVSMTWFNLPDRYYYAPDNTHWADAKLTEGEATHEFKSLEVWPAAQLKGKVVDEAGEPVAWVNVHSAGHPREFPGNTVPGSTESDSHGAFVLGRMPLGATVEVRATIRHRAEAAPVTVHVNAHGEPDVPIVLRLVRKPTVALRGRVLGPGGQPLSGADVRIRFRIGTEENLYGYGRDEKTVTGPDGRFTTVANVPVADQYRVFASAEGMEQGVSAWTKAPVAELPDVVLRPTLRPRKLAGRVVDSDGKPVAGAEVFRSGDDPIKTRLVTDDDGRFMTAELPSTPAFVFVKKPHYRFTARRIGTSDTSVEIVMARADGPAPPALKPVPPPWTLAEERARARSLVAPFWKRFQPNAPQTQTSAQRTTVATLAEVDPEPMIARVEDQVVPVSEPLIRSIALGLYGENPRAALDALSDLQPARTACDELIGFFDTVPDMPAEVRRDLLDRALARARESDNRNEQVAMMANVADRWFAAGVAEKGRALLDEARAAIAPNTSTAPLAVRRAIAEALARINLAAALELVGQNNDDATLSELIRRGAATDPAAAARIHEGLKTRAAKLAALADVLAGIATTDPPKALELGNRWGAPAVGALAMAAAAQSVAASNPARARELLADAFNRLEPLSGRMVVPAVAMARLLPLAVKIDPDRSSEYLWRAIAACPLRTSDPGVRSMLPEVREQFLIQAEVAALVARYDRDAAEVVFAPVAEHAQGLFGQAIGLGDEGSALLRTAVAYDPRAALAIIDILPQEVEPAENGRPRLPQIWVSARTSAVLAVARTLALPPAVRRREILQRPSLPGQRLATSPVVRRGDVSQRPSQPDLWPALLAD